MVCVSQVLAAVHIAYVQKDLLVSGSKIFFKEKFSTDRTIQLAVKV